MTIEYILTDSEIAFLKALAAKKNFSNEWTGSPEDVEFNERWRDTKIMFDQINFFDKKKVGDHEGPWIYSLSPRAKEIQKKVLNGEQNPRIEIVIPKEKP